MDAKEQEDLAGALNLVQLAPDARQPGTYPPQSGGLADSTGTDSREGEAKKGGKKRKNHRGGKKNKKKGDNILAANDTDDAAKEEQDTSHIACKY